MQQKSTMNFPIGYCRRNLAPQILESLKQLHTLASATVWFRRSFRARFSVSGSVGPFLLGFVGSVVGLPHPDPLPVGEGITESYRPVWPKPPEPRGLSSSTSTSTS